MGRIGRLARRPWFWITAVGTLGGLCFLAFGYFGIHTAFIDVRVDEPMVHDQQQPIEPIARGAFHPVAHDGAGTAVIYRSGDRLSLRLEDLDVDNGPDLYVYAVALDDASDSESVEAAGRVEIGKLRGNQGNQSYELPAEFDPAVHRAVVIWCKRFGVNFATAPLAAPEHTPSGSVEYLTPGARAWTPDRS